MLSCMCMNLMESKAAKLAVARLRGRWPNCKVLQLCCMDGVGGVKTGSRGSAWRHVLLPSFLHLPQLHLQLLLLLLLAACLLLLGHINHM